MTLKECLAAVRAEMLVALPELVSVDSEAVLRVEEQNRPAKTVASSESVNIYPRKAGDPASNSQTYPRKPDGSGGQSEIYPTSTCISPRMPVKLVQGEIVLGTAQADPKKYETDTEKVGPLGEARVDRGGSEVDRIESVGEKWSEVAGTPAPPAKPKKPYFTSDGTLRIPFDSDPKYHWWKGGQSVNKTIAELRGEVVEEPPAENVPDGCNY
jgi:hypothetical protein